MRSPMPTKMSAALAALVLALAGVVYLGAASPAFAANCMIVNNPTSANHTSCPGMHWTDTGFNKQDLSYADFSNSTANIIEFDAGSLLDANLQNVNWKNVTLAQFGNLAGVDFDGATLGNLQARSQHLDTATLHDVTMHSANLISAELQHTDFSGADLTGSDLSYSGLSASTNFSGANLSGVNFTGTILSPPQPGAVEATSPGGAVVTWQTPAALSGARPGTCTPASGATFPVGQTKVTCQVLDDASHIATATFNVTVNGTAPTITSPATATFTVGEKGSFTVTTTGRPTPKLTLTAALPGGLTFTDNGDGTATIAGTPTGQRTTNVWVTATNSVGHVDQKIDVVVNVPNPGAPAFTTRDNTQFVTHASNSFVVKTSGSPTPTIKVDGTLPPDVSFTDNGDGTATLTGGPSLGGRYTFSFVATNSHGSVTQAFILYGMGNLTIQSANSTTFTLGKRDSFTVTTAGWGPPEFSISNGSLPTGVTLVNNADGTATLAGTPTEAGDFQFDLRVSDGGGRYSGSGETFTLHVLAPPAAPAITSGTSATFAVGAKGTFAVTSTGSPVAKLSESGVLPGGVTFTDNGDGTATIAGTPSAAGSFPATITASNGVSPDATQDFTLSVQQAPAITSPTTSLAALTAGDAASIAIATTGYPTPKITESGALPASMTLTDNGDGTATLAGTPSKAGSYPITITASNGVSPDATQDFTLSVQQAPAITSPTASPAALTTGTAASIAIATTGYPTPKITESGALPASMTLTDNGDGTATLAGTPSKAGSYPITLKAANGVGQDATQAITLTVAAALTITTPSTVRAKGTLGKPYRLQLSASGGADHSYTWALAKGALPTGLKLDPSGLISGTPSKSGSFPFTVSVNDPVFKQLTITIGTPVTSGGGTSPGSPSTGTSGGNTSGTGATTNPTSRTGSSGSTGSTGASGASGSSGSSGELAETGAPVRTPLLAGLAALLAGVGLLLVGVRHRRRTH